MENPDKILIKFCIFYNELSEKYSNNFMQTLKEVSRIIIKNFRKIAEKLKFPENYGKFRIDLKNFQKNIQVTLWKFCRNFKKYQKI